LKIVHAISTLDPATGGPPAVVARLAVCQARLGHHVTLISHRPHERAEQIQQALKNVPDHDAVEYHYLEPLAGLARFRAAAAIGPPLRTLLQGRDCLHLHGVWEPALRTAAAVARQFELPYTLCPHGMLDPWSLDQKKWKKRLALALGYRDMLNRAAFLHALNADEARLLEPLGLRCPVQVIPNGVMLEEVDPLPPAGAFLAKRPELEGRPYFLFLSRLHHKKGLDLLAEAYARFRAEGGDRRLVVAGPDGGAEADFRRRVHEAGCQDQVVITGPLYGRDKWAALRDATAFVLPTRQEGFSIAVTEALACGKPVVTTHDCHFPEIAEADAGRLTALDSEEIAKAMLEIDRDPARVERQGANGRSLVESRFTWDRIAERTVALYRAYGGGATDVPIADGEPAGA